MLHMNPRRRLHISILALLTSVGAMAAPKSEVPIATGVTFVIAVSNAPEHPGVRDRVDTAHGDYETIVTITSVEPDGVSQSAFIDAFDGKGVRRQVTVSRRVRRNDLATASLQVLGFRSSDPPIIEGTTSLGPSRAIVDALIQGRRSAYSFRNFADEPIVSGVLDRDDKPIAFPVLINGQRVDLEAIRSTGQLSVSGRSRPFELVVFNDPLHPIALRIAWGARGGGFPFKPEFAREVVRIDLPAQRKLTLDKALEDECRAEVPGIYFDFDQATLKVQSRAALEDIAGVLRRRPQQRLRVEGHTDNVGGERYNDDLSARRAAAVLNALGSDFKLDVTTITAVGRGARQPVETNDTLAGRARNRRVELVRDCAKATPR